MKHDLPLPIPERRSVTALNRRLWLKGSLVGHRFAGSDVPRRPATAASLRGRCQSGTGFQPVPGGHARASRSIPCQFTHVHYSVAVSKGTLSAPASDYNLYKSARHLLRFQIMSPNLYISQAGGVPPRRMN